MSLTDPHRATVREKLRPVIDDDSALDALMSQFPASPSDAPATKTDLSLLEASFDVKMARLETRLTDRISDKIEGLQTRLLAILLPFIVAMNAIMVTIVANMKK
ncbi:MAG TPA: hypothetical protein VGO60_00045 [Iamia sp.]|jgi:hypothetical protein|nr:hypothetical protein [Iamia sp.]